LSQELLDEVAPLVRVDIPEVLRWKGVALSGLGQLDEAHRVLSEARALAESTSSNLHLWLILVGLAEVNSKLGKHKEAGLNRGQARKIVEQIAESLREVGLRESFQEQPRVMSLLR
jgi:hypothetical protein